MSRSAVGGESCQTQPSSPPEALPGFLVSARKIQAAEKGKDILLIEEECQGYQGTPLEHEVSQAIGQVRDWLDRHPEELSTTSLNQLLQGILQCGPAVDEYRARYLGAAGDYDDIQSPLAFSIKDLLSSLRKALEAQENVGRFPLTEVEEAVLLRPIKLYQEACFSQELYKFILSDTMGSKEREPFLTFVRRQGDEVRENIRLLAQARTPTDKTRAMNEVVSSFVFTEAEVAEEVAQCLLKLLDDPNGEVQREASTCLGRAGFRVFPFLRGPFLAATGDHRRLLLWALREMEKHSLTDEKTALYFFLKNQPPTEDPEQESVKNDLLRDCQPSELSLAWALPSRTIPGKSPEIASPAHPLEAKTLGFRRRSFWLHYTDGEFARYDATIIKILAPARQAGKEIYLCFPTTPPFEHFIRRPGQRFSCENAAITWQKHRGFLLWPDIASTVKLIAP